MICYLDASALVKRYVTEPGSKEVSWAIAEAETVGTAVISRVEVSSALARAAGRPPRRGDRVGRAAP